MSWWQPQIGLDIGRTWVKAAMRDRAGRIARLAAFPRLSESSQLDELEGAFIAETLERQGFDACPVVVGAGADEVSVAEIEAPQVGHEQALERIIRAEIERVSHCAPDASTAQWWRVPAPARGAKSDTFLTVAAQTESISRLISPLVAAGLDVAAVDLRAAAHTRACASDADADELVMVVDIGWHTTEIATQLNGQLCFVRPLHGVGLHSVNAALPVVSAGSRLVFDALSTQPQLAEQHAWAGAWESLRSACRALARTIIDELDLTLAFLARRFPAARSGRVFIAGGGACLEPLAEALQADDRVPLLRASPGSLLAHHPRVGDRMDAPVLLGACGLALWQEETT